MKSNQRLIPEILARYVRHEHLGKEEMHLLEAWWQESEEHRQLTRILQDVEAVRLELEKDPDGSARMWEKMSKRLDDAKRTAKKDQRTPVKALFRKPRALAAAALLPIAILTIVLVTHQSRKRMDTASSITLHALPGKAMFTRVDGSGIDLDSIPIGEIVAQIGNDILRKIAYDCLAFDQNTDYNTTIAGLSIGVGHRPYTVRMPDGTTTCISDSMQLSINFDRKRRHIRLSGSGLARCDVSPNAGRPLIVDTPDSASIEDMGTSFLVKISDKKRQTSVTLLNGAVRVRSPGGSVSLTKRWQQALVREGPPQFQEEKDTAGLIRWSDSALMFHFRDVQLAIALRQVAWWYKCKIVYKDNVPGKRFGGDLRKTPSLEDIVAGIKVIQGHFADVDLKANTIVVSKW